MCDVININIYYIVPRRAPPRIIRSFSADAETFAMNASTIHILSHPPSTLT